MDVQSKEGGDRVASSGEEASVLDSITADVTFMALRCEVGEWAHRSWDVTLRYDGRKMLLDYKTGMLWEQDEITGPSVVGCLMSDYVEPGTTFEEWASEWDYDVDSRRAEAIFGRCVERTAETLIFLGDDFEAIREAVQEAGL